MKYYFSQFLQEILTTDQKKKVNRWKKGDNSFSDHLFNKPDDKNLTIPLEHPENEGHSGEIAKHLEPHGIKIKNYKAGIGEDKHGREVKLGKALVKTKAPDELKNKFDNDNARTEKGNKISEDYRVTISRHPHHVAGMTSSGHSWENDSCMNFETGCNKDYLKQDVKHGTHIAYLHHKDDKDIEHPLARIALKKFTDDETGHSVLRPEGKTYGNYSDAFHHTVHKFVNDRMPIHDSGVYKKHHEVYDDDGKNKVFGKDYGKKAVEDFHNKKIDVNELHRIDVPPEHLDSLMDGKYKDVAASHKSATQEQLGRWIKEHPKYHYKISENPNLKDPKHFEDLYYSNNSGASHLVKHKNAPENIIDKFINENKEMPLKLGTTLAYAKNLNKKHLHTIASHPDFNANFKSDILDSEHNKNKVDSSHIESILKNHISGSEHDDYYKNKFYAHPKLNNKNFLDKAIGDKNTTAEQLYHLVHNPNLSKEQVNKMADSHHASDFQLGRNLIEHPNLSKESFDKLKSKMEPEDFHISAFQSPHLDKEDVPHVINTLANNDAGDKIMKIHGLDKSHAHLISTHPDIRPWHKRSALGRLGIKQEQDN